MWTRLAVIENNPRIIGHAVRTLRFPTYQLARNDVLQPDRHWHVLAYESLIASRVIGRATCVLPCLPDVIEFARRP